MSATDKSRRRSWLGEMLVPAIMLVCVGVYWTDAADLSAEAVAFPFAMTVIVVVALIVAVAPALLSAKDAKTSDWAADSERAGRLPVAIKTWTIALLPVPLVFFWRDIGAMPVVFVYAAYLLLVLGERRGLWLILVPGVLATALVYLFRTVLYVRLPDVPWMLDG
ncbi:MAG: hypothetical protein MI920_06945 [Kiloniellales bacterium]|nr:hypothetical protein [Kiloniellales bacterium]